MSITARAVEMDYILEQVQQHYPCRVLWSEGRPCLEYESEEGLESITLYVQSTFGVELLDVFFTAVERLPIEEE